MGSWLPEHCKLLRTEHTKTSMHIRRQAYLTEAGCLAYLFQRDHLQAKLPNVEYFPLILTPKSEILRFHLEAASCYHQHMGWVWKADGWTHPYSTLWSSEARQGRRTRNPPGLSLSSSLSREGSPPLETSSQLSASYLSIHTAQLSTSSLLGAPSLALVFHKFTPKPESVPPKLIYQHQQSGLQHHGHICQHHHTYFYHPSILERLR